MPVLVLPQRLRFQRATNCYYSEQAIKLNKIKLSVCIKFMEGMDGAAPSSPHYKCGVLLLNYKPKLVRSVA
jgi:hypothetical protein